MPKDTGVVLICHHCGKQYVLSHNEQEQYKRNGSYLEGYCPQCYIRIKNWNRYLICSQCGKELNGKTIVRCETCFSSMQIDFQQTVQDCQKRIDEMQSKLWIIESKIRELQNAFAKTTSR